MVIKRGDMFYADLSPVVGSEQGGIRPVIIIQNDIARNDYIKHLKIGVHRKNTDRSVDV